MRWGPVVLTLLMVVCPHVQGQATGPEGALYDESILTLAIGHSTNGEYEKAIDLFLQFLSVHPEDTKALTELGAAYLELDQYDNAVASFQKAIMIRPTYLEAHNGLMAAYMSRVEVDNATRHFGEVLPLFKDEIALYPDSSEALHLLGNAYRLFGNLGLAVESYQGALEREPTSAAIYFDLAVTYHLRNDLSDAIRMYKASILHRPDFAEAYYCLGTAYSAEGDLRKAVESWQTAVRLNPNLDAVDPMMSVAGTTRELENRVDDNPDDVMARYDLGNAYSVLGEIEEAEEQYEEVIDLAPEFSYPYLNLGLIYHLKGEYDDAISCFENAIGVRADYQECYLAMGDSYFARSVEDKNYNDLERAKECYRKVLTLDPNIASAHFGLGMVFRLQQDHDEAISAFQRATELDQFFLEAYFAVGEEYNIKLRNSREVVTTANDQSLLWFEKARKVDEMNPVAYYRLGNLYSYEYGVYSPAIENFEKAVSLQPDYAAAYRELALACYKNGETRRADEMIKKAVYLQDYHALFILLSWLEDRLWIGEAGPSEVTIDTKPAILSRVEPRYPNEALADGTEGKVRAKMWVDKEGKVRKVLILESTARIFEYPVRVAAKKFTFKPALKDGEPVDVWVTVPFSFSLAKGDSVQKSDSPPPDFVPVEVEPQIIRSVKPEYPEVAMRLGVEGEVWIKVWVDKSGRARDVQVIKSDDAIFNQASIEAGFQFEFTPAMLNGKPVDVWVSIPFRFFMKRK